MKKLKKLELIFKVLKKKLKKFVVNQMKFIYKNSKNNILKI